MIYSERKMKIEEALSQKVTVLLPRSLNKKLDDICINTERSKSNLIRFILYRSLNISQIELTSR